MRKEVEGLNEKEEEEKTDYYALMKDKKCIIITTINKPNENIEYYSKLINWDLIIVGDSKTEDELFDNIKCIYLGLKEQKQMYPSLYNKIPLQSYTRKMFGYLYAINNKYSVIYDTDDDNKYIDNLDLYNINSSKTLLTTEKGFINIYKLYTKENIWARGIPPKHKCIELIPKTNENTTTSKTYTSLLNHKLQPPRPSKTNQTE